MRGNSVCECVGGGCEGWGMGGGERMGGGGNEGLRDCGSACVDAGEEEG